MFIDLALITACVVAGVSPKTTAAIIRHESGGGPLAFHVNGAGLPVAHPKSGEELLRLAKAAIDAVHSVDIGLMQINVRQQADLVARGKALIDPCNNISAGSKILQDGYAAAVQSMPPGQGALDRALSRYNTGNGISGFANGYVTKVRAAAGIQSEFAATTYSAPLNVYHRTGQ